jgi:aryl-alcohol dehydrogenase-like predicted oxidoreductase
MEYRKFGTTDFFVSHLALGCMSMSGSYGPADDAESIATLHEAFDLGVNFLDTSHSYGNGHNHELIARALQGHRENVVVHTKSGSPRTPDAAGNRNGSTPEYLTRVCEESLQKLQTDRLDVFCMSRVDPDVPIEESVGAMARLVEQGKVRYLGLSEASAESIRRAQKVHPIVSLQMEYSLWSRDAEAGNLQACREFDMGFMAYGPLGHGFLAGIFHSPGDIPEDDHRRRQPRYRPENIEHNLGLLSHLEELAQEKGATVAQLSLAWLLAQGKDVFPIPSNKTRAHLRENLGAVDLKLTPEDLAALDALMPPGAAAGDRTNDMHRVNV